MSKLVDLTGKIFGRLTVLNRVPNRITPKGQSRTMWKCYCICGNESTITSKHLTKNKTLSCGCYKAERFIKPHILPEGQAARNALLSSYKASAQKRKIVWNLSEEKFDQLVKNCCVYCGEIPSNVFKGKNGNIIYSGIDRVDSLAGYVDTNVVSCCKVCNIAKQKFTTNEFLDWARRVVSYASRQIGETV